MVECLNCNNCVSIERDHRLQKACGLMKPLHQHTVDPYSNVAVPMWCPKLKYFMIIYQGATTKGQLYSKKDADLALALIQKIKDEM